VAASQPPGAGHASRRTRAAAISSISRGGRPREARPAHLPPGPRDPPCTSSRTPVLVINRADRTTNYRPVGGPVDNRPRAQMQQRSTGHSLKVLGACRGRSPKHLARREGAADVVDPDWQHTPHPDPRVDRPRAEPPPRHEEPQPLPQPYPAPETPSGWWLRLRRRLRRLRPRPTATTTG
jgi:hypothetical protein